MLKKIKILIAGQEGMVGRSVVKKLNKKIYNLINTPRKKLDFTDQSKVKKYIKRHKPDIVINAAGRVGGILDNSRFQAEYIYTNIMIGFNLINACQINNVKKLINLGSACIYPKNAKVPISENSILKSTLEETNEGYALAKISTLKYCEYLKKKNNLDYISLQPANLYGIGDNFDLESSHVLPALIKKFHIAKINNDPKVEVWGSGRAKREFLHSDDLGNAIIFFIKKKTKHSFINIYGNDYLSIQDLAELVKKIVNYKGKIYYNKKFPDGTLKRKLCSKRAKKLGWSPRIKLETGLKSYYKYFVKDVYKS